MLHYLVLEKLYPRPPQGRRERRLPVGIGRGIHMHIDFAAGENRLYFGLYEIELNRHLRRLCCPGARSFDVGGQHGYDALVFAKLSHSSVISLECDPELCPRIVANVQLNPPYVRVVQVREAFVCEQSDPAMRRLSLDDLAAEEFYPDFIKMDIEGGEYDALLGAQKILSDQMPNLLVETHSKALEETCIELVRSFGYEPEIVDQRRWLREYRPIEHNRWFVAYGRCSSIKQPIRGGLDSVEVPDGRSG